MRPCHLLSLLPMLLLWGCIRFPATPTATVHPSPTPTRLPSPTPTPSCQPLPTPTPAGTPSYLGHNDHILIPKTARAPLLTVLVYGDYQCPPCARLDEALWQLLHENYPIRYVYRHFPLLPLHDKAAMAIQAAEAAALQRAFWPYHRALFRNLDAWANLSPQAFLPYLYDLARDLNLDLQRFTQDMTRPEIQNLPLQAWKLGYSQGMNAVPVVFVDGQLFPGPATYESLRAMAALRLLEARRIQTCPGWVLKPDMVYRLYIRFPQGTMVFRLAPEKVPQAVNAVVFLLQQGWYQGMGVYRVTEQALYLGDPSNTGYGNPGFLVAREPAGSLPQRGGLALEPLSPQWNTLRWLLLLRSRPQARDLTIFGHLEEGYNVLDVLAQSTPPVPVQGVELQTMSTSGTEPGRP